MINLYLWHLWFVRRVKFEDFLFHEFFDISSHLGDVLGTQSNYDPSQTEVYLKNHYKNIILSWFMPSFFTITSHTGRKTNCLIYKLKTGYFVSVKILKYNHRGSQA